MVVAVEVTVGLQKVQLVLLTPEAAEEAAVTVAIERAAPVEKAL
jgi:hypothetical protein